MKGRAESEDRQEIGAPCVSKREERPACSEEKSDRAEKKAIKTSCARKNGRAVR